MRSSSPRLSSLVGLLLLAACGGGAGAGKVESAEDKKSREDAEAIAREAAAQGGVGIGDPAGSTGAGGGYDGGLALYAVNGKVVLDGLAKEWPARAKAKEARGGSVTGDVAFGLQSDESFLYVVAEVPPTPFVRTAAFAEKESRAVLTIGVPNANGKGVTSVDIGLFPGKPGDSAGVVKFLSGAQKGREIDGAKIVEGPAGETPLVFEAKIPWKAFPNGGEPRVGLKGALGWLDGAGNGIGTPAGAALPTEAELAVVQGLLEGKGMAHDAPSAELVADVAGDGKAERVASYGNFLTVAGPNYRGGSQFFFREYPGAITGLETLALPGVSNKLVVVKRTLSAGGATRKITEVLRFTGDEADAVFAQETAVEVGDKKASSTVTLGEKITVVSGENKGFDAGSFPLLGDSVVHDLVSAFTPKKKAVYTWNGKAFALSSEETNAVSAKPLVGPSTPKSDPLPKDLPTPKTEKTNTSQALVDRFKADRKITDAAKIDLTVQLAEDATPERVLLFGRDLVVVGPGFRGGSRYEYLTLQQFDNASDISSVTTRDFDGDGAAELVVRGTRHMTQGADTWNVDLTFVYAVKETVKRVFAIETGRSRGKDRVQGMVQMIPNPKGKGAIFDVRPGKADGFTKESYPYRQEPFGGAIEPLLLPWGGVTAARFAFDGNNFSKVD